MKRPFSTTVVMLLSFAMFFVVVCEGADPVTKPFNAMWSGTLYVVGLCTDQNWVPPEGASGMYLQVINVGEGVSTLAGKSKFISSACQACTEPTVIPPYFCNTIEGSGWGIMTAANGDAIYLEIPSVKADLTKTPPEWTEEENVVGGTGRFKDLIPGTSTTSASKGTWTSGTNLFPCEPITAPPYFQCITPPRLIQPPQGWEGTTEGEITF